MPRSKGRVRTIRALATGLARLMLAIAACMAVAGRVGGESEALPSLEYQVKAAFLYNFARFVEWPPEALGDTGAPIVIAVLGKNPFGSALEQTVRDKNVHGRPIIVHRLEKLQGLGRCHILFISSSEKRRLGQIFEVLDGASILTVGEVERFTDFGGMINFTVEENKVHFEINVSTAEHSGLKISSQLLKLAKAVRTGRTEKGAKESTRHECTTRNSGNILARAT